MGTSKRANTQARARSRAASNAKHGARDEEERKLANLEIYIENLFFFPSPYGNESRETRRKEREIRKGKKRRKKQETITVFLFISNCVCVFFFFLSVFDCFLKGHFQKNESNNYYNYVTVSALHCKICFN